MLFNFEGCGGLENDAISLCNWWEGVYVHRP